MDKIESMYRKFEIDDALVKNVEMLNKLTINNKNEVIVFQVETYIYDENFERTIEKEVINAELV